MDHKVKSHTVVGIPAQLVLTKIFPPPPGPIYLSTVPTPSPLHPIPTRHIPIRACNVNEFRLDLVLSTQRALQIVMYVCMYVYMPMFFKQKQRMTVFIPKHSVL